MSLLAALGLHGALLGVAAAIYARTPAKVEASVPVEVDVEVIAPKPDPIADSAAASTAAAAQPAPATPKWRATRPVREVALVDHHARLASASADRSTDTDRPAVSTAASPVSASGSPSGASPSAPSTAQRAAASATQSAGAVVFAKARYHTNPKPDYPLPSFRRQEEGIVLLNVLVQTDGTPAAISLKRSSGHPLLDRAALDAVRRWTFEPARAGGLPVSSLLEVPVVFSLGDQP